MFASISDFLFLGDTAYNLVGPSSSSHHQPQAPEPGPDSNPGPPPTGDIHLVRGEEEGLPKGVRGGSLVHGGPPEHGPPPSMSLVEGEAGAEQGEGEGEVHLIHGGEGLGEEGGVVVGGEHIGGVEGEVVHHIVEGRKGRRGEEEEEDEEGEEDDER